MEGTIKIKLVRSPICTPEKHKRVVQGPGLAQAEPGGGAAGHAGLPRHGEEGSASAASGGIGQVRDSDSMNVVRR